MKCSEVMKRDALVVNAGDSVQVVAQEMITRGVSVVPVIDGEKRFRGALTDRSLVAQVIAGDRQAQKVKAAAVAHPLPTVGPDDEHSVAEQKMREAKKTRAAVVDADGHYLGLITLAALAEQSPDAGNLLKELRVAEA